MSSFFLEALRNSLQCAPHVAPATKIPLSTQQQKETTSPVLPLLKSSISTFDSSTSASTSPTWSSPRIAAWSSPRGAWSSTPDASPNNCPEMFPAQQHGVSERDLLERRVRIAANLERGLAILASRDMHKIESLLREKNASNSTIAVEIPFFGRVHMGYSQISTFSSIFTRAVSELELSLVDVVLDEHDCHKARCRFLVSCRKSESLFGLLPSGVRVSNLVTLSITYGDDLRPKEWIFHERAKQIEPSLLPSVDSIVEEEIADDRSDDNKALVKQPFQRDRAP